MVSIEEKLCLTISQPSRMFHQLSVNPESKHRREHMRTLFFQRRCRGVSEGNQNILVGGFFPTHLKHMRKSNWRSFPNFRGENKTSLKPPSSIYLAITLFSSPIRRSLRNRMIIFKQLLDFNKISCYVMSTMSPFKVHV